MIQELYDDFHNWLMKEYKAKTAYQLYTTLQHANEFIAGVSGGKSIRDNGRTAAKRIQELQNNRLFKVKYKNDMANLTRLSQAIISYCESKGEETDYSAANKVSETEISIERTQENKEEIPERNTIKDQYKENRREVQAAIYPIPVTGYSEKQSSGKKLQNKLTASPISYAGETSIIKREHSPKVNEESISGDRDVGQQLRTVLQTCKIQLGEHIISEEAISRFWFR